MPDPYSSIGVKSYIKQELDQFLRAHGLDRCDYNTFVLKAIEAVSFRHGLDPTWYYSSPELKNQTIIQFNGEGVKTED